MELELTLTTILVVVLALLIVAQWVRVPYPILLSSAGSAWG